VRINLRRGVWRVFLWAVACGVLGAAGLAMILAKVSSEVTWNVTPSLPRGLYLLRSARAPVRGDLVAFEPPAPFDEVTSKGLSGPHSFKLLKRLVAVPGDAVCLDGDRFVVNGALISRVSLVGSGGQELPKPYRYCGILPSGEGLVATPPPTSLDSRFFGPVRLVDLTAAEAWWTPSSL
jgi:conjugative transfer signal peptidase TraF